ncbi:hypothetical protein NA56DRAFT_642920 [Hyaloscypha hepaticicola]|uniref:Uncharacterized protein n=1 Tax=Hyaloscypha hepaticicola TaxID=2082293 RepID=A0A2J6QFT5_9HELO|nr:hypothetical protein NA56DRAFT_642920 [Hyaloscypha hepaticicola]
MPPGFLSTKVTPCVFRDNSCTARLPEWLKRAIWYQPLSAHVVLCYYYCIADARK